MVQQRRSFKEIHNWLNMNFRARGERKRVLGYTGEPTKPHYRAAARWARRSVEWWMGIRVGVEDLLGVSIDVERPPAEKVQTPLQTGSTENVGNKPSTTEPSGRSMGG